MFFAIAVVDDGVVGGARGGGVGAVSAGAAAAAAAGVIRFSVDRKCTALVTVMIEPHK